MHEDFTKSRLTYSNALFFSTCKYHEHNTNTNNMSDNSNSTGLIGGHVQYAKGAAEAAIGSVTGSAAWSESGEKDKSQAIDAMKAANQGPKNEGLISGETEAKLGSAFGCEGMVENGKQKQ
ncbi:hypothetical protein PROFUN_02653 [Planoprotostelium fungivorum]|uniref:Uncharacterized protein n=1 Tax=Planoprotostelium fungivorum TaxID=1890364 RepID=A0A2P6NVG1_9EUKA|nr:hypothetical protein PROFUN_02653 [Planoprotostelium fungivorum]